MEASPEALKKSDPTIESTLQTSGSGRRRRRQRSQISRAAIPGAFLEECASSPWTSPQDSPDSRSTTPPQQHGLDRHSSGLPPTPPTLANSDLVGSQPDRSSSPAPLFADRVRNALETQKARLSTPVMETNSPPTPDPSPPSHRAPESLPVPVPRPPLNHQSSSYADSFKTATEGRSTHGSTSEIHLLLPEFDATPRQSWIETNRSMGLSNSRLTLVPTETANNDPDSDVGETRIKNYHIDSDGSGGDDDDDDKRAGYSAEDEHSLSESAPSSPSSPSPPSGYKSMSHQQAMPRLRQPIQPGDHLKRPNDHLLYGSLGSIRKWKRPARMSKTPPAREMDTEFLRNAQPVPRPKSPDEPAKARKVSLGTPSKALNNDAPLTALPPIPPEERRVMTPQQPVETLRAFAPARPPKEDPSPPSTAQKEKSLEGNNVVYKMIQEENAKRHSAISDVDSVQVRIVSLPETKRQLRHIHKRDSLRGDMTTMGSSTDNTHRLRHKRAMGSLGGEPPETPERIEDYKRSKQSARTASNTGQSKADYRSAISDDSPNVASATALGNPHKLRRSIRENSLDRSRSVSDSVAQRNRTYGNETPGRPSSSPKLRRSSADHRLETDTTIRRTSLSHELQTTILSVVELESFVPKLSPVVSKNDTGLDTAPAPEQRERTPMAERVAKRDDQDTLDTSFKPAQSPRRKSLDYRRLHSSTTPMSTSQFSGTVGSEADICEARGVALYPHHNESVLVIQGTRLASRSEQLDIINASHASIDGDSIPGIKKPHFEAFVTEPDEIGKPLHSVESPLTNPRTAPEPPVIQFIPPTPNDELERQLAPSEEHQLSEARPSVPRRPSLKERVRRYSENLVQPLPFGRLNSQRRPATSRHSHQPAASRPTHLSSFWQPRDFWEDYSSDEEDEDGYESLPAGGDTSEVADAEQGHRSGFLPRALSKRMPGFRGTGGFLVGNSLGIDRHGTNVRRHYVARKTSEEMLRRISERKQARRSFSLPFSDGAKRKSVGSASFAARVRDAKKRREERALEKRREKVRDSIGMRVFHEGGKKVEKGG